MGDASQHERASEVFLGAVRLDEADRGAYLQQACGDDAELLAEVRALIAHDVPDEVEPRLDAARRLLERLGGDPLDLAPDAVSGYRILGVLGHGGSSLVLRALQRGTDREVALKLLHLGSSDEQLSRRLALEAHLLGMLDHPGIARVLESGEYATSRGPQPFLAMELVHGKPLNEYCTSHALGLRERVELLARVADAVQHAHQSGVIHRDLKPGNILVTEDGQPKVLDFGIARTLQATGGLTPTSGDRPLLGTLGYMSPEQLTGDGRRVDMRSDIYTLGVLAYEVLAERAPFETRGEHVPEVLHRLAESDPVPLGQDDARLRGDLEAVVGKAMERDRTRRYGSAADFAADLRRYLAHESVTARRPSRFVRALRTLRKHPLATVSVAGVILALSVGLWVKQQAIVEHARELQRFERLFEDLAVFLNDPHVDDDGELVALDTGTLREKLAHAAGFIERRLADQPDTAGSFHVLVARLLKGHGTTPEEASAVRAHFERGAELLAASLGAEHPSALQAKRDLATHLVDGWDLDAAERVLDELRRDGAAALEVDHGLAIQVSSIQARLFRVRGQKRAARQQLERALELSRAEMGERSMQTVNVLVRLLAVVPAGEGLALVEAQRRALPEPIRPRLALRLDRVEAQLLQERGEAAGDVAEQERAHAMLLAHHAMCVEQLGAASRSVVAAEVLIGRSLSALGRHEEAVDWLARLCDTAPERLPGDDPLWQRMRLLLARAQREAGDFAGARATCAALLDALGDTLDSPTVGDGEVLLEAARCALGAGDAERARELLARTRAMWAPHMDRDHELWAQLLELEARAPADA